MQFPSFRKSNILQSKRRDTKKFSGYKPKDEEYTAPPPAPLKKSTEIRQQS